MSTLVVDSSVVIHWLVEGSLHSKAVALLELYAAKRIDLIAPHQIVDEVSSTLSKLHRRKLLTHALAKEAFREFEDRRPEFADSPGGGRVAFELALTHQISYWDSLYLTLAVHAKAGLITADRRFHRSIARHYPDVRLLA